MTGDICRRSARSCEISRTQRTAWPELAQPSRSETSNYYARDSLDSRSQFRWRSVIHEKLTGDVRDLHTSVEEVITRFVKLEKGKSL